MSKLSEAIKEAYASAPAEVVILHTLELRNSGFRDEDGNESIRLVQDTKPLVATLEANAPENPGETVTFEPYAFEMGFPKLDDNANPEVTVTIDNVGQLIPSQLSGHIIELTYRPYLSTDTSAPHCDPPLHLVLREIVIDAFKLTGRAGFKNLANLSFPNELYTPTRFPGLIR